MPPEASRELSTKAPKNWTWAKRKPKAMAETLVLPFKKEKGDGSPQYRPANVAHDDHRPTFESLHSFLSS